MKILEYLKPYIKEIIIVVATMFLNVLGTLFIPRLTSNIIDIGVPAGDISYILKQGMIMGISAIIAVISMVVSINYSTYTAVNMGGDIRRDMFIQFEKMSIDQLDSIGPSSLITRSTDDILQLQNLVRISLRMLLRGPLMLIGAVVMAYNTSRELSRLFIYFLPVLLLVMVLFGKKLYPLMIKTRKLLDSINREFRERLTGIKIIRAFDKEEYEEELFNSTNEKYTQVYKDTSKLGAIMRSIIPVLMNLLTLLLLYLGSLMIVEGQIGPGALIAFISYSMNVFFSFMMISMIFMQIPRAQASVTRINEVLDMEVEESIDEGVELEDIYKLEIKDLYFKYPGTRSCILQGVNFSVNKGDTLAIIGPTGSGKSTLARLLMGFYEPTDGNILINDRDISEYSLKSLRSQIGYAEQKAALISGTVGSNVTMGIEKSEELLWESLSIAQAEFVEEVSDEISQRGQNLSGGQQQRISIARSIYKEPSMYLIDDAFSALDYRTERKLRSELLEKEDGKINIIITQRAAVAETADEILVLDNGKVAGLGKHDDLIKESDVYRSILESQDYYEAQRYLSEEVQNG